MKKALFLQSWYSKVDDNWYPWLKNKLEEKGYKTYFPDLPTIRSDTPDMSRQLKYVEKLTKFDPDTTVIGHSIGSLLAMRLAEKHQFKKAILISGWDYDDLTEGHKSFWVSKINHEKIKKNVSEIYVIHSDNDPYTTAFQAEEMTKRLSGKFILVKNAGHFLKTDGVEKLDEILELI